MDNLLQNSPTLQQVKYYFDLLHRTMEGYPFITDLKTGITMIAPELVKEYDLPGTITKDFGSMWEALIYHEDVMRYQSSMAAIIGRTKDEHRIEYRVKNKDGEYGWVLCNGIIGKDEAGEPNLFVGVITKMDRQVRADPVTGLLNRYAFETELEYTAKRMEEDGETGAIIIIGLDNFQILQDNSYDSHTGDIALREIGRNLGNVLPTHLNLYKLDGERFGIIWPHTFREEIEIIFYSIQICLREMKETNEKVFFSASAGVVFYPESGTKAGLLQKYAKASLDMAQQNGREQLNFFSPAEYKKWMQFINLQRSFEDSIERGCEGFLLYYQPQVDAKTGKLLGCEALLRWQEPDGEIISPIVFIPILERTRLIIPVGRWVVNEAIKTCKKWQEHQPGFEISINVSLCQLENYDFHACVEEAIQQYDLDPRLLTLELTESQSVSNWDFVNEQFGYFREMGVKIAMDDFGVGYSSLGLLKNFNCDIIKVDKVFVDDIIVSEFDRKLVKYTVQLCQSIGMVVCIEGVEEKEAYEYLAHECNADMIQGFYFGRPEPEDVFVRRFSMDVQRG